ncbi:polyprenyl synthetase family protein [Micromonospora tulbaghiae]|uniref:Geranylgeranyl diphosphate synthase, type I n=1 Tax=Micromonospora tulbaghiae TaxID=479978 RepID=A0AAW4J9A0_9ACTN|nr:polyprenyl synthetase family protein [Micromonospora tulbaghiae]MBO4138681.1 polyprenyl synthetase family protein [Micromonospora tulbaghiae]MDX5458278.1 polyprenyl synthetase family protein [Micromonospora tulbaghiae]SCE75267.1 geranylgeranyl diphosphate synthase, type I [Micromonospora tulbaghiae]
MTVAGSTRYPSFIDDLARSESGRLLRAELGRRWPETPDRLDAIVRYALLPAGKMLRPMMTLHAAEAVGGSPRDVLAAALGTEYLHVATLVHDDIIDADTLRRGRPAVPVAYGIPGAIVAGDHLIFHAFQAIVEGGRAVPPASVVAAVTALAEAGQDLCRGQAMEERLVGDLDAGARWYPEMIRLKTGSLFRAVCHIGALLGGAEPRVSAALARYGEHVGTAFQIRDDLLSYLSTPEQTGKPATSDLNNGRPTLPLLLAYDAISDAARVELLAVLHRRGAGPGDVEWVTALLRDAGAVDGARRRMVEHAERARAELAVLTPSASADVLTGIAAWMTSEMA